MADFLPEKEDLSRVMHAENQNSSPEEAVTEARGHGDDLDADLVRKLIRKVDWRIMPALGLLYAVSLIDRVNLSVVSLLLRRT